MGGRYLFVLFFHPFLLLAGHPTQEVKRDAVASSSTSSINSSDANAFPLKKEERICCRCYYTNNNVDPKDDQRFKSSCQYWYRGQKCANANDLNPIPFDHKISKDPEAMSRMVGAPVNPANKEMQFLTKEAGCTEMRVRFESHGSKQIGKAFESASMQICVDAKCCGKTCKDFYFEHTGCSTIPVSEKENFKSRVQSSVDRLKAQGKLPPGLSITLKANQAIAYGNDIKYDEDSSSPIMFEVYNDPSGTCEVTDRVKTCDSYTMNAYKKCLYSVNENSVTVECKKNGERKKLKCLPTDFDETNQVYVGFWTSEENFAEHYPGSFKAVEDIRKSRKDKLQATSLPSASGERIVTKDEVPIVVRNAAPGSEKFKIFEINGDTIYQSESGRKFKIKDGRLVYVLN